MPVPSSSSVLRSPLPLALVLSLSLWGCDQTCTLMYAPSTLTLRLENADLAEAGEYTLLVEGSDGQTASCTLPANDEAAGSCADNELAPEREGSTVTLSLWEFAPDAAEVTLLLDGAEQGTWTITPTYAEDEPNGEGCGTRRSAEETIDLSAE